jgi:transposase-like protein
LKKKHKKHQKGKFAKGKHSRHFCSHEYKLKAVKMVLEDGCRRKIVADQLGCCYSALVRWITLYQEKGPAGLSDTSGKGRRKAKLPKAVREQIL